MIALKCTSCGANLQLNESKVIVREETAVLKEGVVFKCGHCGTKYVSGAELPQRPLHVSNTGGINFTAGRDIKVSVGGNVIMGDKVAIKDEVHTEAPEDKSPDKHKASPAAKPGERVSTPKSWWQRLLGR